MPFVGHDRVPVLVVLAALLATAGVFVFFRPQYQPRYESKMIDFSQERYISPQTVRTVFARNGIRLHTSTAFEFTVLSSTKAQRADDLQVLVGPRTGTGSFGPTLENYDKRFDNVAVIYGGSDEQLLERVKHAVDELR